MSKNGGGSSQTTTVKSPKPFITQDFYSPEFLQNVAGVAQQYQDRATMLRQRRENMFNTLYTKPEYGNQPVYSPIQTPTGAPVDPREVRVDAASVIPQKRSFYEEPKIKGGGGGKKKRERDKYLSALAKNNEKDGSSMGAARSLRS